MTDYSADYLRRLVEAVEAFESTFEAWIANQHLSDGLDPRRRSPGDSYPGSAP